MSAALSKPSGTHFECAPEKMQLTDEERLAQLGHEQQLKRRFSLPALAALCLCLMATWEALSSVLAAALTSGGPPCLLYNYIACFLASLAIASSLGEVASIYPTSGGQYHWTAALAPVSSRAFASWITGWISVGGQIVFTSSAAFASGLQFQACITMNNDSYQPQRWHGMLLTWLVLLYAFVMNVWGLRLLPHVNVASGILHIGAFVGILVTLGVMSDKNTSSFVFTRFENNSGWSNDGISWLVGLQSAVYPFLGYDAASHLAEELHNPSRNVPLAMVGSVLINGSLGLVYCIILLYSSPSLDKLLNSPFGNFPFMEVYLDVTNSRAGATVMSLTLCFVAAAAAAAGSTSTSRTLWAFARDKGTPFHSVLSRVTKRSQLPLYAVIVITVLEFLLGLIYLGSSTAFNAILSMSIMGMYLSYMIPIAFMLFGGRGRLGTERGFFNLGSSLGPALNVIGLVWMTVAIVFSTFPTLMPVTSQNMNYSVVVMAGWVVFGLLFYLWFGRHKFEVPLQESTAIYHSSIITLHVSTVN